MNKLRTAVLIHLALLLSLGLVMSGCNQPKDEMRRAENALADARDAGAMDYARDDYLSAEKLLEQGKELMANMCNNQARKKFIDAAERARLAKQNSRAVESSGVPVIAKSTLPLPPRTKGAGAADAAESGVSQGQRKTAYRAEEAPARITSRDKSAKPVVRTSYEGSDRHVVKKGECLWWIAEYRQIYDDPFQWPIIYEANRDQIRDPDLIYPGQKFVIPRGVSTVEVKQARRRAGAPAPYLPPGY